MLLLFYVRRLWTHIFGWFSLYSGLRVFLCIFRISVFDSPVRRVRVAMAPNIPIQMELNLHSESLPNLFIGNCTETQTCEPNSLVVLMNIVHRTTFLAIKFIRESMSFKVSLNLEKLYSEIIEASAKLSENFGNTQSISGTLKALQEQGTSIILKAGHRSSVKVDFI